MYRARHPSAFSLVELSIVLVILGLLVGGILAGKSLIRASELRSATNDFARYKTSILAFRDKYFSLPGDMPNAAKFWGAQAGPTTDGPSSACYMLDRSTPATGQATCNGDGNGRIGMWAQTTSQYNYETYRAWQQMANAGLVTGTFSGVTDSVIDDYMTGNGPTPGYNVPPSRVGNGGFNVIHYGSSPDASSNYLLSGSYEHVMVLGIAGPSVMHNQPLKAVMAAEDAWNIDMKMDDGLPGQGSVRGPGPIPAGCVSTNSPDTAAYRISVSGILCPLIFKLGI